VLHAPGVFFKLYHHADGKVKEAMGVPVAVPVVFGRFRSFSVVFGHSRSFPVISRLIPENHSFSFLFVPHSSPKPRKIARNPNL
jgi:hypothetical protein